MTEFAEKLVLMVTDKLLLGALIGLGWYWAQLRLERYKAAEQTSSKLTETRVNFIADLCVKLGRIEATLLRLNRRTLDFIDQMAEYFRRPDSPTRHGRYVIRDEEFNRLRADWMKQNAVPALAPDFANVSRDLDQIDGEIEQSHFWLGPEITTLLQDHLTSLKAVHQAFSKATEGEYGDFAPRKAWDAAALKRLRLEINRVLAVIRRTER